MHMSTTMWMGMACLLVGVGGCAGGADIEEAAEEALAALLDGSCGDGVVSPELGEACDDGNTSDADGCSSTCQVQEVLLVAGGGSHTCAVLGGGSVKCWGYNGYGQIGVGDKVTRGDGTGEMGDDLPVVNLGTGKEAVELELGTEHSCAVLSDGGLRCWGNGMFGRLGLGDGTSRGDDAGEMGDVLPAVALGTGKTAVSVGAGVHHTCALLNDGSVKCWGSNSLGQLGSGVAGTVGNGPWQMGDHLGAVSLGSGKTAVALAVGYNHGCAVLSDGSVKCWGSNSLGQLGIGSTQHRGDSAGEMGDSLPSVNLGTGKTAVAITAGFGHSCALLNDGSVKCWGDNGYGQLGLGDTADRGDQSNEMGNNLPAVSLGAGKTAVAISAGHDHTCALLNDSHVKCWGYNGFGQLGVGDAANRGDAPNEMGDSLPAVSLGSGSAAVALRLGGSHSCAVLDDGSARCWGYNAQGQLGLGDNQSRGAGLQAMGDALPAVKLF